MKWYQVVVVERASLISYLVLLYLFPYLVTYIMYGIHSVYGIPFNQEERSRRRRRETEAQNDGRHCDLGIALHMFYKELFTKTSKVDRY